MRTIRLTSAKRTCYLAAGFLTIFSLQLVAVRQWSLPAHSPAVDAGKDTAPASVSEVLQLVGEMKRTRAVGRTDRETSSFPATMANSYPAVGGLAENGLAPRKQGAW